MAVSLWSDDPPSNASEIPSPAGKVKLRAIRSHTGLRGVAALLVIAYHLQYEAGHLAIEDATTFFRRSYLMVDLFFVLSGFIIAYKYEENSTVTMTARQVKAFLIKRFDRIYPLHFFVLLAMVGFKVLLTIVYTSNNLAVPVDWSGQSTVMLAAQFLLVNVWMPYANGWNIPSWSISAEFVAYLVFPAMVWSSVKYPRIAYGVMTVALLSFYLFVSRQGSLDITGGVGAVARCLSGFFAGFIIHANRKAFDRMSTRALSVLQIGSVAWIMISLTAPIADRFAVPAFIILVGSTWPDRGIIAKALSTKITDWLGERSYAVYISHVFIIELIRFVWLRTGQRWISSPDTARLLFLILCFSIVLVVANVLYAYVERRIRRSMNRRLVRTSPKVA